MKIRVSLKCFVNDRSLKTTVDKLKNAAKGLNSFKSKVDNLYV